jgi:hypothetical protein
VEHIDFYEVLGISKSASAEDIRAAYRNMSKTLHPDAGGNAALFRLINEAYQTLSNSDKRRQYDLGSTSDPQRPAEDINYVRFEDAYRQWRMNKMKTACPPIESWNAGGVRRLVRSSALIAWFDDPSSPDTPGTTKGDAWCGMCGFVASRVRLMSLEPLRFQRERYGSLTGAQLEDGDHFGECEKCQAQLSHIQSIILHFPKALDEPIDVKSGDYLLFARNYLSASLSILGQRSVAFGRVVQGSALSEFSLRNLKIEDEYTGKLITPTKLLGFSVTWASVLGHWKSNDLSQLRSQSTRNWSANR